MLESYQTSTGTGYTTTVALLAVAFVFSPAILFLSRPFGYKAAALAITCSVLCAGWAWINWSRRLPVRFSSRKRLCATVAIQPRTSSGNEPRWYNLTKTSCARSSAVSGSPVSRWR